jgi:hypothetical protein
MGDWGWVGLQGSRGQPGGVLGGATCAPLPAHALHTHAWLEFNGLGSMHGQPLMLPARQLRGAPSQVCPSLPLPTGQLDHTTGPPVGEMQGGADGQAGQPQPHRQQQPAAGAAAGLSSSAERKRPSSIAVRAAAVAALHCTAGSLLAAACMLPA